MLRDFDGNSTKYFHQYEKMLADLLREHAAPPEQFERLGLS